MKIAFLTPVGPGHQGLAQRAGASIDAHKGDIDAAWLWMLDQGSGRSATRNALLDAVETACPGADYLMWLDADDELHPDFGATVEEVLRGPNGDRSIDALWGSIYTNKEEERPGQYFDLDAHLIAHANPTRTLNIGYLIRPQAQLRYRWNEEMDCGEDFDMYLRLWSDPDLKCHKTRRFLYLNNRGEHSKGARAHTGADWRRAVASVQMDWQERLANA